MRNALIAITTSAALAFTGVACSSDSTTDTSTGGMNMGSTEMSGGGSSTSLPAPLPQGVNAADVAFAEKMIPHHRQAVEMSQVVIDRGTSAQVKALAQRIEAAQGPEIELMTGWLSTWGQPLGTNNMPGMDMTMQGMMSDADMQALDGATGGKLDLMYVEGMIKHHQGAVTMAEAEVKDGQDADAVALANKIIDAQKAEIAEMQALLPTLKSA